VCIFLPIALNKDGMEVSTTEQKLWTSLSLINWGAEYLGSKEIDSPRLTCELLLTNVLNCSRIDLYSKFDRPLSTEELAQFKRLLKRRLSHEPLQYILGQTEFMGLRFVVDRRVLIPRPETEILVEQAIALLRNMQSNVILDIGTGSGNIAISVAKFIPDCKIDAVDISAEALEVAAQNVAHHGCERQVNLCCTNILQEDVILPHQQYDLIVSNPPYISQKEYSLLQPEIRDFEPRMAATDAENGLTFFHAIAKLGKRSLAPGGWVIVEHAYDQSDMVKSIFHEMGYQDIEIAYDYDKIPRVVKARRVS
jgi:release factor glutamine methyltransferase